MTGSPLEPPRISFPVRLGRKEGLLVEIDGAGARVRHTGPLKLGGEAQLAFSLAGEVFVAASRVLSCRVAGLGLGEGGATLFESRLRFDEAKGDAVERLLGAVGANSQISV
jgi:hypothetical protein